MYKSVCVFLYTFLISQILIAQSCVNNSLTVKSLANIKLTGDTGIWNGSEYGNLSDVSIFKSKSGPKLENFNYSFEEIKGLWISKNNNICDTSVITLTFSKPILSLSFLIGAINNDKSGFEKIGQLIIYDSLKNDITSTVKISWIADSTSGVKSAKPQATNFNSKRNSLASNVGFCCNEASGRLKFESKLPFYSVQFSHQEVYNAAANGVILSGDINFCVLTSKQEIAKEFNSFIKQVQFEYGKYSIQKETVDGLNKLSNILKSNPLITIELQGHTDNTGNENDNLKLSEQRTNAIKDYLVRLGVNENRITTKGFGNSKPLVPNISDENKAKNRRVDIIISGL